MTLLAKSAERGGLTLREHTEHVVVAAVRMAGALGLDGRLARLGAVLHDLGKAHPFFQAMLRGEVTPDERTCRPPHRHELSSLLLLPLFDEHDWPALIEMVAGHHKSVRGDRSERGLMDMLFVHYDGPEALFACHAEGWEDWMPQAVALAHGFDVTERKSVSLDEARRALDICIAYCRKPDKGWSDWRGLLMSADHFASGYQHEAERHLEGLYHVPDVEAAYGPASSFGTSPLYPLSLREDAVRDKRPHTLLIAPTGAGKTNFLLRRCRSRVFYTLPYQASINAMYRRLRGDLEAVDPQADVRRLHAASRVPLHEIRAGDLDELDVREDAELQQHPGASIKVTTPHQLAGLVLGTAGHEITALDVRGQDVILDEIHTYDGATRSLVLEMVRALAALECRVHVGTATIPDALARLLLDALGGDEHVCTVTLSDDELRSFNRHEVIKLGDDIAAADTLRKLVTAGKRVLIVNNRVARAQAQFDALTDDPIFKHVPLLLLHSRFRRNDRAVLEHDLMALEKRCAAEHLPCVAIATQVVEVSLNLSFDAMVTDAAPLDALIQRFGRVNRRRHAETAGRLFKPVYVIAPPKGERAARPYDADVIQASFEQLPGTIGGSPALLEETTLSDRISNVYPAIVPDKITMHTQVHNGRYRIRKLHHMPRSVLSELLEIDSETGVLARDLDDYKVAAWDERAEWEIPLPQHVRRHGWRRLDVGSYPVVVPDEAYDPTRGYDDARVAVGLPPAPKQSAFIL